MAMMLRETITQWNEAVTFYDRGDFHSALRTLTGISEPTSKILFNIGCIHLNCGQPNSALEVFSKALIKDQHLAIGHFQHGVAAFKVNRVSEALESFKKSYLYMRGNTVIDYRQLGLPLLMYSTQVVINIALCLLRKEKKSEALKCLSGASSVKSSPTITSAITQATENCQNDKEFPLQELPVSAIFRPLKSNVANLEKRDFIGKAKIVASVDDGQPSDGFSVTKSLESSKNLLSVPILGAHEAQHSRSVTDLSSSESSNPGLMRLPPKCPPPRLPNRKIVCVQKSFSLEDLPSASDLLTLKTSNKVKNDCSQKDDQRNDSKSNLNNLKQAPGRPPPIQRPAKTYVTEISKPDEKRTSSTVWYVAPLKEDNSCLRLTKKRERDCVRPPPYPPPRPTSVPNPAYHSPSKLNSKETAVVAVSSYEAEGGNGFSFKEGEIITIEEQIDKSWFQGRLRGKSGKVPWTHVQLYTRKSIFK